MDFIKILREDNDLSSPIGKKRTYHIPDGWGVAHGLQGYINSKDSELSMERVEVLSGRYQLWNMITRLKKLINSGV